MKAEFKISGIHCKSCIALIKMNIEELSGIKSVEKGSKEDLLRVDFDDKKVNVKDIISKIESDEYKVVSHSEKK